MTAWIAHCRSRHHRHQRPCRRWPRECPAGLVTGLQHSGARRQPQRSAERGSYVLDGLGEHGLARTKFSRMKPRPGEPNRGRGSSAIRPRPGAHCAVARHLRCVGGLATHGRPPAVAAREHGGSWAAVRPPRWRRRMLSVSRSAPSQDWPVVRAATVAPRTANRTATNWSPAVRPRPAAAGTEDSLAQAGLSPFSPAPQR